MLSSSLKIFSWTCVLLLLALVCRYQIPPSFILFYLHCSCLKFSTCVLLFLACVCTTPIYFSHTQSINPYSHVLHPHCSCFEILEPAALFSCFEFLNLRLIIDSILRILSKWRGFLSIYKGIKFLNFNYFTTKILHFFK